MDEEQLAAWEEELVNGALEITGSRERYFHRLQEAFTRALSTLNEDLGGSISLHFNAGWNREHELGRLLYENRGTDRNYGVTRYGPHRADILAAELDEKNREKVFQLLCSLGAQLFITCVAVDALESSLPDAGSRSLFHVEHGTITA